MLESDQRGVRITLVFLVAHSESHFGSKIDQKTHPKNQNQVPGAAMSFLARETVGFCLNAHAGPSSVQSWSDSHAAGYRWDGSGPAWMA
jgi:hypothetical protein